MISASIPTLTLNDSIFQALELMSEFHITQLAVIAEEKYLGLVFEEDLMNVDGTASLQSIQTHFSKVAVRAHTHFIESVQTANDYNLTIVPVIENENEFVGVIPATDLLKQLGKITGASEPGGLIILEMDQRNFSFAEISKLVETNDAQITQLNTYWDNTLEAFL